MWQSLIARVATLEDEPGVSNVLAASYAYFFPDAYDSDVLDVALPLMVTANPTLLSSGLFHVVATEAGTVVGCGGWSPTKPGTTHIEAGVGHIRHFATHPDWKRRGIGRMLYERCQQQAIDRGIGHFLCWSSLNGQAFYAAMGFMAMGRVEARLGEAIAFPAMEMMRTLRGGDVRSA